MKLYERIENNNFDEIDKNRAIELIEGGNGHLVYNENYFKLQKENKELKKSKITYEAVRDIQEKNKNIVDKKYISKQKVREKIEDYIEFLDKIKKQYDNKTILIVTHGGFIKALYYNITYFIST